MMSIGRQCWKPGVARIGILLALLSALVATSAAAAQAAPAPEKHCAMLISKHKHDSKGNSLVLSEACAATQTEATSQMFAAAKASTPGFTPASSTELMEWWSDQYWSGSSTLIYGNAGTCDSSGYSVTPNSYWKANLSSITRAGNCNYATETGAQGGSLGSSQSNCLSVPTLAAGINDNVAVVKPRYVASCY